MLKNLNSEVDKGKYGGEIFPDLKKGFDTVDHWFESSPTASNVPK